MSKSLPPNPNLENLKKQAKSLLKAFQNGEPEAFERIRESHKRLRNTSESEFQNAKFSLRDAQQVIAGEYGYTNWQHMRTMVHVKQTVSAVTQSLPPESYTRFSNTVKQVVTHARQEAMRLKHDHIGPEHFLLGIIQAGEGTAKFILEELSVTPIDLQRTAEKQVGIGQSPLSASSIPIDHRAKKILEMTANEAQERGTKWVETGHLLLALARNPDTASSQTLMTCGVDYASIEGRLQMGLET